MRSLKLFSNIYFIGTAAAVLTACSLYQSDGREAIEKDTAGLVTSTGVSFSPKTRYECVNLVALPTAWQVNATSLDEYTTLEGMKAILHTAHTMPTVVVYSWLDHHAEACTLTVLDAKLSSQNLSDVVALGESLLLAARR